MLLLKSLAGWKGVLNVEVKLSFHSGGELAQDAHSVEETPGVIAVVRREVLEDVVKPYRVNN